MLSGFALGGRGIDTSGPVGTDPLVLQLEVVGTLPASPQQAPVKSPEELALKVLHYGQPGLSLEPGTRSEEARTRTAMDWLEKISGASPDWTRLVLSNVVIGGRSTTATLEHELSRVWTRLAGFRLPHPVPLHLLLSLYAGTRFDGGASLTVYLAPSLGDLRTQISPVLRTNSGAVSVMPQSFESLLASNGLAVVRIRPWVLKIYPEYMAREYKSLDVERLLGAQQ